MFSIPAGPFLTGEDPSSRKNPRPIVGHSGFFWIRRQHVPMNRQTLRKPRPICLQKSKGKTAEFVFACKLQVVPSVAMLDDNRQQGQCHFLCATITS
jgi:hypothetical protein